MKVDSLSRHKVPSTATNNSAIVNNGKKDNVDSYNKKNLKDVSREFESLFLNLVLKSMRQTIDKSKLMDGGHAEKLYQGMLDSEYAKIMSKMDHTGLGAMIEKQLNSMQKTQEKARSEFSKISNRMALDKYKSSQMQHMDIVNTSLNKE